MADNIEGADRTLSFCPSFKLFYDLHIKQIISSGIPRIFWNSLYEKLLGEVFDAGEYFNIAQIKDLDSDNEIEASDQNINEVDLTTKQNGNRCPWTVLVKNEEGISSQDGNCIFLIDHAWTYRTDKARSQLLQIPGLLERMSSLMDLNMEGKDKNLQADDILTHMWKFNQFYSIGGPFVEIDDSLSVWYIMDEFGSRIQHSITPNFRIVPFLYLPEQISYSLLFPIEDVPFGGEVTRNYVEGPTNDPLTLKALTIPWCHFDFTHIDCDQSEADEGLLRSGRIEETLPDLTVNFQPPDKKKTLKVYSEYKVLKENLQHNAFEITDNEKEADILWLNYHFKHYQELSEENPHKFINQFPFEHIITVKDLLAITSRRNVSGPTVDPKTLHTKPAWLSTTFNLKTELPKFVSYFQQSESRNIENCWICKPWNLARSLDIHITDNLNYILRLPATGPKIACKYITNPVLFPREDIGHVKFDLRYVVLLKSVTPLKVYAYKRFWLRFANRPFSLDEFEDYEKHFTVMNYKKATLKQLYCHDFVQKFEEHYSEFKWSDVQDSIFGMLRELFDAATKGPPPSGIGHSPQSRAVYAADIMLKWQRDSNNIQQIQPVLLEMNWSPDCHRACQYYPDFYDDLFSVLFLDDVEGRNVQLL